MRIPFRIGRMESGRKESNLLIPVLAGSSNPGTQAANAREARAPAPVWRGRRAERDALRIRDLD